MVVEQVELAGSMGVRRVFPLCTLDLAAPAPHILASRVTGMGSAEMVEKIIEYGDALLRDVPQIQIFHDFTGVDGYRSESRKLLVDWGVRNKDTIAATHVLFRSKVVAMGVSIAKHLLRGQLEGYSDRAQFEAALAEAIEQTR